jgi:DNA processing protein
MFTRHEILALGFLPGITSATIRMIVERCETLDRLLRSSAAERAAMGMKRAAIEAVTAFDPYLEEASRQLARAREEGGVVLSYWDEGYPAALRQIYAPPVTLYALGDLDERDHGGIAIVGTREATIYGRITAERYASEITATGVTVISGLARGIDTFAHAAALREGGRTIAVVAAGLDRIAPSLSAALARRIATSGAVISEYPFGVRAIPAYFPQRNRIISGMAAATLVVESDLRGGAMITAGFALDQNREVFAVPGPISSPKSRGTNHLIRTDRARLTQEPSDMLESLGYRLPAPRSSQPNNDIELTLFERQIHEVVTEEPLHVDTLCEMTGLAISEVLVSLLTLELKGMVRQMAGRMFLRA